MTDLSDLINEVSQSIKGSADGLGLFAEHQHVVEGPQRLKIQWKIYPNRAKQGAGALFCTENDLCALAWLDGYAHGKGHGATRT